MAERTMTLQEAAEATGLSRKALELRCDRGKLRYVLRNGRRRIPVSELVRLELLVEDGERPAEGAPSNGLLEGLVPELLGRLEAQAEELGRLRALTAGADAAAATADALEAELAAAKVRVQALEEELEASRRRRWWRRGASSG